VTSHFGLCLQPTLGWPDIGRDICGVGCCGRLQRKRLRHVALPAEKVRDPVNREVIFCAAGVLSATLYTYSVRRDDSERRIRWERMLLFYVGSGTDKQRAGVTGETVTPMTVRGPVVQDGRGRLTLTDDGRAARQALLRGL
jgi:hypothetical protein